MLVKAEHYFIRRFKSPYDSKRNFQEVELVSSGSK